jgi:hypothetical protein
VTSEVGTKRTYRAELTMSVEGVKRKSAVRSQTDANDPQWTLANGARNYAGMGALRSRAV